MKRNKKKVSETKDTDIVLDSDLKRHTDSFSNPGANTGFGQMNLINTTQYPLTRLSQDWNTLTSMYRSSWIVQRVCSVMPEDCMTDLWIEAADLTDDERKDLDFVLAHTKVRRQLIDAFKWARLYGGAAAVMMIDGSDDDLSQPLNVKNIQPGAFKGLFVVDRWSGIYPSDELVSNNKNPDFGLPRYYDVRDEAGNTAYRVHHSRVLRFTGTTMPYYEQMAEQYWGTSAIESMYDDLVRHDNVLHNIAALTFKANLSVYEIENLDQMFATAGANAQRRTYQMLQAMNMMESNLGFRLINKGDSIQQLQANFSGLPEILDGAMLDVSGATAIPAARLFGREPAGMNSTGESDERNYRDTLRQQRAQHLIPNLEKLCPVICMSAIGRIPDGVEFGLPDLQEMSLSDKEDVVDKRESIMEKLFQLGIVPADAVLNAVRNVQSELGLKTTIDDDMVKAMTGKYLKDINPQEDPFGGVGENSNDLENDESSDDGDTENGDDEVETSDETE